MGDEEHSNVAMNHASSLSLILLIPFPFMQDSVGRSVSCVVMGISGLVDTALCRSELPKSIDSLGRLGNLPGGCSQVTAPSL